MRLFLSTVGALGALQVLGVNAQADPACITGCVSETSAQFTQYGCVAADQVGCLCPNAGFMSAIQACASTRCAAAGADITTNLNGGFCQSVPVAADAADASSAVPTTEGVPATTEAVSSEVPATTSVPAETTEEAVSSTASEEVTSSEAPATTTEAEASTTSAAETTEAASSTAEVESSATESSDTASETASATDSSETTDATEAAATSTSEDEDEDDDDGKSGLSSAAQIGVGVGIGAAVLAIGSLAACFLLKSRRRKQQQRVQSLEISQPLPGGGRQYASGGRGYAEKNGYDIEMTSNRYEDMVPRATPRNMV